FSIDAAGNLNELGSPSPSVPQANTIAFDPVNNRVVVANFNTVMSIQTLAVCGLVAGSNQSATTQSTTEWMRVDPQSHYLEAIGTGIWAFRLQGGLAPVPGNPFLNQAFTLTGAVLDSQRSMLYITAPQLNGSILARLGPAGEVTSSTPYAFPGAPN